MEINNLDNVVAYGNHNNYDYIYTQEIDEETNTITLKLEIKVKKDSKKTDNIKEKIRKKETLSNKELLRKL